MSSQDHDPTIDSADPRRAACGIDDLRCEGSGHQFPPIETLRPPKGAPNVLVILIDDVGFGASSAFGGPCQTPNFEKLAAGGLKYTRFHTTALCSPTRQALLPAATITRWAWAASPRPRPRPRDTPRCLPNTKAPLPLTLKLNGYSTAQFGKCHEVPVWQTSPAGPFTAVADRRRRVRVLLRLHRRREQPVGPGPVRGHHANRAAEDPGRGLPPHRGSDRQGDQLGAPAEGAAARQAVLHVLRARRHPRAAPRAEGVDRQVQGQVRPRLGQAARDHLRAAEGTGRHCRRCGADPAPRGDPGLG